MMKDMDCACGRASCVSLTAIAFQILLLVGMLLPGNGWCADITRISDAPDGSQSDGHSGFPDVSADGRYTAFASSGTNLVTGDTNGVMDVFVHDAQDASIARVSVASDGTQADQKSGFAAISANGRYVLFASDATNLISGDTNNATDCFVHDRDAGTTSRISVASDESQGDGNSCPFFEGLHPLDISSDGRYAVFGSLATNLVSDDTNSAMDVFLRDTTAGTTTRASLNSSGEEADQGSTLPRVSDDGRYVAFRSFAANMIPADGNGENDIFLRDMQSGQTSLVSGREGEEGTFGSGNPDISSDGRYVAFSSAADNLVTSDNNGFSDVFLYDSQTFENQLISQSGGALGDNDSSEPRIAPPGIS